MGHPAEWAGLAREQGQCLGGRTEPRERVVERRGPHEEEVTSPSGKRKTHCQAAAEGGAPGPGTDSVILSLWL